MDPSTRSTATATAAVVVLVGLAIAVLLTVGGRGPGAAVSQPVGAGTTTAAPVGTTTTAPPRPHRTARPHHPATPTPTAKPRHHRKREVCVPQVTERTLTVMTFNIKSARVSGHVDLGRVADQIARYHPDVALLQEVDRGRAWSNRLDMPAVLGARLSMQWVFGANVVRSPTNLYGTAILSHYPLTDAVNTLLPRSPGAQQRGLLTATVDVDGIALHLFDTHLDTASGAERERQIARVADLVTAVPGPKILGGDLNSIPGGSVLARARTVLRDTWLEVGSGPGLSAPSGHPRERIDYLLYDGSDRVEVIPEGIQVLPTDASDHRAVLASYRLRRDDGPVCVPLGGGR